VLCEGEGTYDDCRPIDRDEDGNEVSGGAAEDDAVLRPVERYLDPLWTLENIKNELNLDQQLLISVIGGVSSDGSVTYADSTTDPELQQDFGIGPGCESTNGRAVPPVRLRELADAFAVGQEQNMFSICNSDYSDALEAIAKAIAEQVQPSCVPACVADTDPTLDGLDPSCVLVQQAPRADGSFEETEVDECEADGSVPDGEDVCYVALIEDERSDECVDQGFNLEFRLERREGAYVVPGTGVTTALLIEEGFEVFSEEDL
jgi:hypothetical protein